MMRYVQVVTSLFVIVIVIAAFLDFHIVNNKLWVWNYGRDFGNEKVFDFSMWLLYILSAMIVLLLLVITFATVCQMYKLC